MKRISLFLLFLLTACQPAPALSTATLPPSHVTSETITSSPIPTETLTPSPTPTIDELILPYTIDGLRQHKYQSGTIHIRSTLSETDKYTGYLIDYPSDGLTITGVMQIPKGDGPFPVIVMNHGFFARRSTIPVMARIAHLLISPSVDTSPSLPTIAVGAIRMKARVSFILGWSLT